MKIRLITTMAMLFGVNTVMVSSTLAQTTNQQSTFALKQMLPTSPEAALLGRFGDIPVGSYTGTADITIPFYQIKAGNLEIPISLSYHSSGIKVEDMASNVGLGWLMEPGGAIVQITNGIEDIGDDFISMNPADYALLKSHVAVSGYHGARNQIGYDACPCHSVVGNGDSYQSMQSLLQGYLEPDIFQYSFPGGYSGKFYINPENQQPVAIDKKDQISFSRITGGWQATTNNGNKYYFTALETASDGTSLHNNNTWKLSKIVMFDGRSVDFGYTPGSYTWTTYSETFHSPYPIGQGSNGFDPPLQSSQENYVVPHNGAIQNNVQTISQIKTKDVLVKFNQVSRLDMTVPAIQSVDVFDNITGAKIKTITFNYSYFDYSTVGGTYLAAKSQWPLLSQSFLDQQGKRLKLVSVQETGYQNGQASIVPAYKFTYNESVPLPLRSSFARDYWGYYNGINNSSLAPDLNYFYITSQIADNFPFSVLSAYNASNRAVDPAKMSAGMLNKIQYPTGGTTTFDYEPNSFTNYDYPDVQKINNSNQIRNIFIQDKNDPVLPSSVTFSLPHKVTLPFSIFFGKGIPQNPVTFNDMLGAYVVLYKISGGTTSELRRWVLTTDKRTEFDNNGGISINDSYDFPDNPSIQYQIVASIPDALGNQQDAMKNASAQCTVTNVPQMPTGGPKLSFGGGMRIAAVKNYDTNGTLLGSKSYKYVNEDQTSSGILMSPLLLVYDRLMHLEYLYNVDPIDNPNNPAFMRKDIADADIWWITSDSATPFSYAASGNVIGYSRVEEILQGLNSETNGKNVFYYHNFPSENGYNTPDNPDLKNGKIEKEQSYDATGNLKQQSAYDYVNLFDFTFNAYKVIYNVVTNYGCDAATFIKIPQYPTFSFLILNYPINSKWFELSDKATTQYFSGGNNTVTEHYTYNSIGQISSHNLVNSLGENVTTTYKWPFDIAASDRTPVQKSLIDSSFYDHLLEEHHLKGTTELSQAKITYALNNNRIVRSQIDKSINGKTPFTDVVFDSYGSNKNIQQFREKGLRPASLIWDSSNSNIIATAQNALITDIAFSSFEVNQPGNWTIPSSARDNILSLIGSSSYNLASGALVKSGLKATNTYRVTYWTRNSTPFSLAGTIAGYPIKGATLNGWTYYEHQVTGVTTVTISGTGNIDELRLYPSGAQMSTYTYKPLVGITTSVDAKNMPTYYEYDELGRLKNVKDKDGNIVKHTDYHYQGQ